MARPRKIEESIIEEIWGYFIAGLSRKKIASISGHPEWLIAQAYKEGKFTDRYKELVGDFWTRDKIRIDEIGNTLLDSIDKTAQTELKSADIERLSNALAKIASMLKNIYEPSNVAMITNSNIDYSVLNEILDK